MEYQEYEIMYKYYLPLLFLVFAVETDLANTGMIIFEGPNREENL